MDMLERDAPLAELQRCLAQADAGQGVVVLLSGEAGVGKTSLLNRFLAQCGARVLLGRCDGVATPRPLAPVFDLNEPALTHLLLEEAPREVLFRAVLDWTARRHETSVLAIEDVHWADEATLDLLRYLGRRIAAARSLLIATFRDDEVGPRHPLRRLLGDLATVGPVCQVDLVPLSLAAVRHLAHGSGQDAAELHTRTGGNPFYVTEALASPGAVPRRVSDAVLARASRLSPAAWQVLTTAAVMGSPIDPAMLQAVAAPGADDLEACLEHGMLVLERGELAFRHELARLALEAALSPLRRQDLHRRILQALEARPAAEQNPARMAYHAEAAGDAPAVLRHAREAARRSARLRAYREEAHHHEVALRFAADLQPAERAVVLMAHARAAYLTANIAAALASCQAAVVIWTAVGRAYDLGSARVHLAGILWAEGRIAAARQEIQAAVTLLERHHEQGQPPAMAELAEAYATWARLTVAELDSAEAQHLAEKAITLATACGTMATRLDAQLTLGEAALLQKSFTDGESRLTAAIAEAAAAGLTDVAARGYLCLGHGFAHHGRLAQAIAHAEAGLPYAREHDLDLAEWHLEILMAQCHLRAGAWDEALRLANRVLAAREAAPASRFVAQLVAGLVMVRRGQKQGLALLDQARDLAESSGSRVYLAPYLEAQAEAAVLLGKPTAPWAGALTAIRRDGLAPGAAVSALAYWGWVCGGAAMPCPDADSPYCLQVRGQWANAAEAWRAQGTPYEAARALAEGDDETALRTALALCDDLDARPLATQVRRRLRALGAQTIPRGPHDSTRRNPLGLTSREAEVLQMLMAGATTSAMAEHLHLSPRTVENHIAAICTKLGVSGRAAAIDAARRLGLTPESE